METINLVITIATLALAIAIFAKSGKSTTTAPEVIDLEKQLGPTLATFEERSLNHLTRHKDELRNTQTDNFKLIQESMEKLATSLRDESR